MRRYGIAISYYGGMSWAMARLEREAVRADVPLLGIRGAAYPEMARAEQLRQALLADIGVVVFLDASVVTTLGAVELLVEAAEEHGFACGAELPLTRALSAAAVRLDVVRSMAAREASARGEQTVKSLWNGEEITSLPLASPWTPSGASLSPGAYLTDSEAFVERVRRELGGPVICEHFPDIATGTLSIRTRIARGRDGYGEPGDQFAVCVASFGALDSDQQRALFALEEAGMMVISIHECPWIDIARGWLAERALESGRGVFFVDHDIIFDPRDVIRVCAEALDSGGVVGAGYSMRKPGRHMIGAIDVRNHERTRFFEGGGLRPAFYTGMGFTAIPKSVIESIDVPTLALSSSLRHLPLIEDTEQSQQWLGRIRPWFALDCSTGYYAGEDVSFCNRVHDLDISIAGGDWVLRHSGRKARVFMDTTVRVGHRGAYDYHLEDVGVIVPLKKQLDMVAFEKRAEAAEFLRSAERLEDVDDRMARLPFPEDIPPSPPKALGTPEDDALAAAALLTQAEAAQAETGQAVAE